MGVGRGDQLYSHETLEPGFVNSRTSSLPWLSVGQQRPRLQGDPIVFELDSVRRERETRLESAFFIGDCCRYTMVVRLGSMESTKKQNSVELP